jgi:hypothetical protein
VSALLFPTPAQCQRGRILRLISVVVDDDEMYCRRRLFFLPLHSDRWLLADSCIIVDELESMSQVG